MPHRQLGRGVLNPNNNKKTEKSPDYFGSIEIGDTEYKLAAWQNKNKKSGEEFLGLSVSVREEDAPEEPPEDNQPTGGHPQGDETNDDIPF